MDEVNRSPAVRREASSGDPADSGCGDP